MNGNSIVADTNVLIYLLTGDSRLIDLLENSTLFISFITEIELLSSKNLTETDENTIHKLLSQSSIVDINSTIKNSTISIRSQYGIKIPDAIIAATSIYLNIPLVTSDSDFKRIKELDIVFYEK